MVCKRFFCWWSVHPHVRGVYGQAGVIAIQDCRFIPTCVGYTSSRPVSSVYSAVHPHVRGVYPHVIGLDNSPVRFIPTCVGYTDGLSSCGTRRCGSSPRAWGILTLLLSAEIGLRFIPTCVGYTTSCSYCPFFTPVHPHVRGVYLSNMSSSPELIGSSPRAWGIREPDRLYPVYRRFIPTCVGYTEWSGFLIMYISVHPHVRGVYVHNDGGPALGLRFIPTCVGYTGCWGGQMSAPRGSSPRAWGIHFAWRITCCITRFIPTCVGYTLPPGFYPPERTVHPHVRGVYARIPFSRFPVRGSSPRAWGIPC